LACKLRALKTDLKKMELRDLWWLWEEEKGVLVVGIWELDFIVEGQSLFEEEGQRKEYSKDLERLLFFMKKRVGGKNQGAMVERGW
jgi:hypothetical protein